MHRAISSLLMGLLFLAIGSVNAEAQAPANCGMQLGGPVVFCDTFDAPAGTGNRSGQLNGEIWGVSRWTGDMNFGPEYQIPWVKGTLDGCNGPQPAQPDGTDIIICNGQMRQVVNDNPTGAWEAGGVVALTMYPKQPFDFAGRTGTVSFDVSNDTQGTHGAWPEFWLTDKPIPTPFTHFNDSGGTIPQHGFGLRFGASVVAGQGAQLGPNCPNDNNVRWSMDSAIVIRNYVIDDTAGYGVRSNMSTTVTGCVIAPTGPDGGLNHVEIRIAQNLIEVWATDAGTTTPLKKIAVVNNPNLTLSRGLIWIEDVHYNADKSFRLPLQHNHTFVWDNVAFDGPATYRDKSYDVNDSLTPCHDGTVCLGWMINSPPQVLHTMPMDAVDINAAVSQRLMFTAYFFTQPTSFNVTINGHPHTFPWPFPFTGSFQTSSFSFDLPKTDLTPGPQAITISADQNIVVGNVNIVLVDVGPVSGGTPVAVNGTCGSANAVPVSTQPSANLCLAGTSSAVTGSGPWNWSCNGSNGGSNASCSAPKTTAPPPSSSCQFTSSPGSTTAFCEDLSGGVSPGGRAGDLDDSKWGTGRFVQSGLGQTNLVAFPPTPVGACKAGVSVSNPDNDIMVCDAASGHLGQFHTSMIAQNYAMMSLRPRQAFDFAGRTGTITFNVDAITQGEGSWWPAVYVTDEPTSGAINSSAVQGLLPANGIGMNFNNNCGVQDASLTKIDNVFIFNNYVESSVDLTGTACFQTQRGALNHIEIRLSQTSVQIWASDKSLDGGVTFPNFRMVGSAVINLPFTRGYVHFQQKERAPIKNEPGFYSPGYANNYWSKLGFDGPVVGPEKAYQVSDSLTVDPNSVNDTDSHIAGALNIGYGILNNPNSMFSCCDASGQRTTINSFSIPNVDLTGATSAKLTFSTNYTYVFDATPQNVVLKYSLNGGPLVEPNPQPNLAASTVCPGCPGAPGGGGGVLYSFPVSLSNLVSGNNTISFAVENTHNGFPAVISNIDLLLASTAPVAVNGTCGSANGVTVPTAPSTNLCSTGAASAVAGAGPWTWSCAGSNGGTTASCSAPKTAAGPVNGACGSANGTTSASAPSANLCTAGAAIGPWEWRGGNINGVALGPWSWHCQGSNGGAAASCSAAR